MNKGQTSIRIERGVYAQVKALADETNTGIAVVAGRLIGEGLSVAENAGKVIAKNPEALAKVQKDLAKMKDGQEDILERLEGVEEVVDELEGEEGAEALEPGEVKPGRQLEIKPPSVSREDVDGYDYKCINCKAPLAVDGEKGPETCPACGEKLDWNHLQTTQEGEGQGGGATPWMVGGFLVLLALAALKAPGQQA